MTLHDFYRVLVGAALEVVAPAAIVFVPEILDDLQAFMRTDSRPGER